MARSKLEPFFSGLVAPGLRCPRLRLVISTRGYSLFDPLRGRFCDLRLFLDPPKKSSSCFSICINHFLANSKLKNLCVSRRTQHWSGATSLLITRRRSAFSSLLLYLNMVWHNRPGAGAVLGYGSGQKLNFILIGQAVAEHISGADL